MQKRLKALDSQSACRSKKISIMMIILGSLGAIAETSIAVASGLVEILEYDAQMGAKQLFKAGIAIGEKNYCDGF